VRISLTNKEIMAKKGKLACPKLRKSMIGRAKEDS
jgi:hypothetical protein